MKTVTVTELKCGDVIFLDPSGKREEDFIGSEALDCTYGPGAREDRRGLTYQRYKLIEDAERSPSGRSEMLRMLRIDEATGRAVEPAIVAYMPIEIYRDHINSSLVVRDSTWREAAQNQKPRFLAVWGNRNTRQEVGVLGDYDTREEAQHRVDEFLRRNADTPAIGAWVRVDGDSPGLDCIPFNIWDDYSDFEGSTHGYVEEYDILSGEAKKAVCQLIADRVQSLAIAGLGVTVQEDRLNTERTTYTVHFDGLTYNDLEVVVSHLQSLQLTYEGLPIRVYSES